MGKILELKERIIQKTKEFLQDSKKIGDIGVKEYILKQKFILGCILVAFLGFGVGVGGMFTSKDEVLRDLEIALKDNKPSKIVSHIDFNGESLKSSELKPITTYYSENRSLVDSIIRDLKAEGKSGVFSIKQKKRFLSEIYYIDMKSVAVKVESNFEAHKIFLNDDEIRVKGISRDIIPGEYTIVAKLNTEYGEVESAKEIALLQDETIKLDFDVNLLTIASNYEDASVFINNIDTNLKVKDIKNYGPVPTNKGINIFLQKEFPWGTVKSENFKVSDVPLINIPINGITEKVNATLEEIMTSFYTSTFEALNNGDPSSIKHCEEDVKTKVYNELNSKAYFFKNNYEIAELNTEIQEGELSQSEGQYKSQVVAKVKYKVFKKILPFLKTDKELFFIVNLVYENGEWVIVDTQNINY